MWAIIRFVQSHKCWGLSVFPRKIALTIPDNLLVDHLWCDSILHISSFIVRLQTTESETTLSEFTTMWSFGKNINNVRMERQVSHVAVLLDNSCFEPGLRFNSCELQN